MPAVLPALLAALFTGWCGTLIGGVSWTAAAASQLILLSIAVAAGGEWPDPLRLGRWGRWLPLALVVVVAASLLASPVPRAGRVGVLLLPSYLILPAMVARAWRDDRPRAIGTRALAVAVAAIAAWSLLAWRAGATPRPAAPLGHHLLLSAWLITLLPLALLPAAARGRWRWLGWAAGAPALAAVGAGRSLHAVLALAVQGALWLLASRRRPRRGVAWVAAAALVLLLAAGLPRLVRVARGEDPSARARATYATAALKGFAARPLLGWGPGATPWTAARFLDPVPGVNPPGEAVGELHSLPLQLLYELGLAGALAAAALVACFLARRRRELAAGDSPLALAGLLGLAGAAVCALGSAAIAVTALPVAAAIAAGAALATRQERQVAASVRAIAVPPSRRLPPAPAVYAALAATLLLPLDVAHRRYDRALTAHTRTATAALPQTVRAELLQAVRWDPAFPLYRARLAAHHERSAGARAAAAGEALRAARAAGAVAPLWTLAGALGASGAAEGWVEEALLRACALAPLEPLPPFYLSLFNPQSPDAPARAARALAAEPRLAAALAWEGRPELFAAALREIETWRGLDAGWRESLVRAAPSPAARRGAVAWIEYGREGAAAPFSPYLFRRRPWPAPLVRVPVRARLLPRLALPPATALTTTARKAFADKGCVAR